MDMYQKREMRKNKKMNEKKKDLEKVSLGIAIMFGIYWIYSIFIQKNLNIQPIFKTIIGLVTLYVIGLFLFINITKKIPNTNIKKSKVNGKSITLCFLLQFTAFMIMSVLVNIFANISGQELSTDLNTLTPYMIFMLTVFNPIVEEFVFRKVFADKLLKYGELFYMMVSSFCFAIVHGVSLGIPQIIYTFILGMIWSYLFVKTGNIKLPILLHSLSNIFGSIIIQTLQGISMEITGMYSIFMMMLAIIGLICFIKNKKRVELDNKNKLLDKTIIKEMFTNKGIIFYTLLTISMMIIKNIAKH